MTGVTRREFLKAGAGAFVALGTSGVLKGCGSSDGDESVGAGSGGAEVHVILGDGLDELYSMGGKAAEALGILGRRELSGKTIFLKPNLMTMGIGYPYDPHQGECAKAEIVIGVAEQCLKAGAARVVIGDGAQGIRWDWKSYVFFDGNTVFGETNLEEAVDRLRPEYPLQEIELLCLNAVNEWELIPSSSDHEIMQHGLRIARSVVEADHVVSIAVLKSHLLADMTGSMKNFVGVTPIVFPYGTGFVRTGVHRAYARATSGGVENAGIAGCFTDILKWRKEAGREDFAVIDCSVGLEGTGPTTILDLGKPIDIRERSPAGRYFLLASRDLAAADTIACRVMNLNPSDVKQLRMADSLGLGETRRIRITGDESLEQLCIRDFVGAAQYQPEWGASAPSVSYTESSSALHTSRKVNTLAGPCLPAAAVPFLRRFVDGPSEDVQDT